MAGAKRGVAGSNLEAMDRSIGTLLIAVGIVAILVGVAANLGWLAWFGRLPGDIRHEGENSRVFIPITSMVIISIVLTVLVNLFARGR